MVCDQFNDTIQFLFTNYWLYYDVDSISKARARSCHYANIFFSFARESESYKKKEFRRTEWHTKRGISVYSITSALWPREKWQSVQKESLFIFKLSVMHHFDAIHLELFLYVIYGAFESNLYNSAPEFHTQTKDSVA